MISLLFVLATGLRREADGPLGVAPPAAASSSTTSSTARPLTPGERRLYRDDALDQALADQAIRELNACLDNLSDCRAASRRFGADALAGTMPESAPPASPPPAGISWPAAVGLVVAGIALGGVAGLLLGR